MRQPAILNQLEKELHRCSREHGQCSECEKHEACVMEYDSLVDAEKLNQQNIEKFLREWVSQ